MVMNKNMTKMFRSLLASGLVLVAVSSCMNSSAEAGSIVSEAASALQVSASHSDDSEPNYEVVFPDDRVNEIVISISADNWQIVNDDMMEKYGEFGSSSGMGGGARQADMGAQQPGAPGGNRPQMDADGNGFRPEEAPQVDDDMEGMPIPEVANGEGAMQENFQPPVQGGVERPQMDDAQKAQRDNAAVGGRGAMGGGMMGGDDDENPIWVEAAIEFNGETWEHVGFRLKGNSSLKSSWGSGSIKLPFKLDFDEFEDEYEETRNQRFYGFKQLTFSSNFSDSSYLKEKLAADIFRDAGVPSAQTAFYAVYLDYGEGPVYVGLYTAVEVVDDTLIQTQFEDDSGNVYKPSGAAATFAVGTYNEEQYDKETNQDEADYSDLQALLDALHSNLRMTDAQAWRAELESIFDVDNFLQWLAVNSVMQNWDTYGSMSHNYYLYHDPVSGQLVWIPWDNNQSFSSRGGMGGGGRTPTGNEISSSIGNESVGDNWPLISYLLADEVYWQKYVDCVEDVIDDAFTPDDLAPVIQELHDLINPYVEEEIQASSDASKIDAFDTSVSTLIALINQRYQAALEFLADYQ